MTIHYHGTPITPRRVLDTMAGRHFCVSFAAPGDVKHCHAIGQSVMLDNGAFSAWKRGVSINWAEYYFWCERWLQYPTTWAVIPDVIDAGDCRHRKYDANDALIREWPHGHRGAPVWHMHEHIDRLLWLASEWPRICIGSSKQYRTVGNARWHGRMAEAMNALYFDRAPTCQIHMLRGMQMAGSHYPFASLDSTDVARNHNRPQNNPAAMAAKWDAQQCPATWERRPIQAQFLGEETRVMPPKPLIAPVVSPLGKGEAAGSIPAGSTRNANGINDPPVDRFCDGSVNLTGSDRN